MQQNEQLEFCLVCKRTGWASNSRLNAIALEMRNTALNLLSKS